MRHTIRISNSKCLAALVDDGKKSIGENFSVAELIDESLAVKA